MTPVLASCIQLQMDGSPRLIRVERMDLFENHFFNHVLSAGIVFRVILEVSDPLSKNAFFLKCDISKVKAWDRRVSLNLLLASRSRRRNAELWQQLAHAPDLFFGAVGNISGSCSPNTFCVFL